MSQSLIETAAGKRWRFAAGVRAGASSLPLLAIFAFALALRLAGLGDKPLWLDEVATLHRATISLSQLVSEALHAKHYPSYFLLLWLVAKFGTSTFLLRLPSAILGAIDCVLVYAIGRDADEPRTGLAAGVLTALSPFDVQLGQEARSYALVACFILIALWGLVRLAREPDLAAAPLRRGRRVASPWLAYGGGTIAALNVLNTAVPWFLAANLGAVAIACRCGEGRRAFLRNWGIVQAIVLALWLPSFLVVSLASHGENFHGDGWAPPVDLASLWSVIAPVYLDRIAGFVTYDVLPARIPAMSFVVVAMACVGAWRWRDRPAVLATIAAAAFVLPVFLIAVSLDTSLLVPRYFAWSAAPFFIIAAAGLGSLSTRPFAVALASLAAIGLVNLAPYYRDETKPRWDLAAARLAAETHPGDLVLVNSFDADTVLTAFLARSTAPAHPLTLLWRPRDAAQSLPGRDFWAVYGRTGQGPMPAPADYLKTLAAYGKPASVETFGRYIVIWHFSPPAGMSIACTTCPAAPQSGIGGP
jgi:mannosyltransferase